MTRHSPSPAFRAAAAPLVLAVVLAVGCSPAPPEAAAATAGDAATWSAPAMLPASLRTFSLGDHRVADLAAGPDGRVHVLFLDDADGDRVGDRLLYAASDGGRWSEPVMLDDTPGLSEAARLAVDGRGLVHVFWYESRGDCGRRCATDLLHREWDGRRWSAPAVLYHEGARGGIVDLSLAAGIDLRGTVHLLHTRAGQGFGHRVLAGGAWQPARSTDRDGLYLRWGRGGDDGGMEAVYVAGYFEKPGEPVSSDVWVRPFRDGAWGAPAVVYHDPQGYSHDPQLTTGTDGVRHAVWLEGRGGIHPRALLHATSRDGVRWSAAREITPAEVPGGVLYSPRLAVDRRGVVHLTFARFGEGYSNPRHFHMRLAGGAWSPARQLFPEGGSPDSELETAFDGAHTLHAVWKEADGTYRHARLAV